MTSLQMIKDNLTFHHFYMTYIKSVFIGKNKTKQEGQRCPKRRVAQAAIRLATAVITFRNMERNVTSPS